MSEVNKVSVSCEGFCPPPWIGQVAPFVCAVLDSQAISHWDLSIVCCTDAFIRRLNYDYRGIDSPTDVLSFENDGEYCDDAGTRFFLAGDIIISLESVRENSERFHEIGRAHV